MIPWFVDSQQGACITAPALTPSGSASDKDPRSKLNEASSLSYFTDRDQDASYERI